MTGAIKRSSEIQRSDEVPAPALAGRRIVVTRAPEQSEELAWRLREFGAEVLFLPTVRFVEPEDTSALDQAIAKAEEFDWIIFTSANAARFFLKRCARIGRPLAGDAKLKKSLGGERVRIAAVGPATQAAVEAEGFEAKVVPAEWNGDALAGVLNAKVSGKRVLLPRSDLASRKLPEALRAAGAKVNEVVAYRTAEPDNIGAAARAMLLDDAADAVTFFSPSAFHHLGRALGDNTLHEIAARTAFAAVGPVTAAAIRDAGFTVAAEASEASSTALVAALEGYFTERRRQARLEKKRAAQKERI